MHVSRSDVALQEAGKTSSFAPHSPVLAKEDEDTHNHASASADNGAAAAAADDDAAGQQSKGIWSWLCCCVIQKPAKSKDPAYEDNKKTTQPKSEVPLAAAAKPDAKAAAPAAGGGGDSNGAAAGGGGAAALVTQVQQGADVPQLPMNGAGGGIRPPPVKALLGPLTEAERGKKTLVLDLDETLVHSSFKPIPNADFVISIELENVIHRVFVLKRPGVDAFLRAVGQKFEVVVFTASLAKYADPLLDILDRNKVVKTRLFREACVHHYGSYVKDLSHLGRRLEDTIIVDNSPFSYMFQPDNAIPITSWFNDKTDRQLYELMPFLDQLTTVDDVCTLLRRRKQQQLAAGQNMA